MTNTNLDHDYYGLTKTEGEALTEELNKFDHRGDDFDFEVSDVYRIPAADFDPEHLADRGGAMILSGEDALVAEVLATGHDPLHLAYPDVYQTQ